jgi:hypothetical protein
LEQPIQNTILFWDYIDRRVSYIEHFKSNPVDAVEADDHEEQPPGGCRWEEVGVDATRVPEDEAESGFGFWVLGFEGVEEVDEFESGPDDEAEEEWIAGVVSLGSDVEKGLRKRTYAVFPARIMRDIVRTGKTAFWKGI